MAVSINKNWLLLALAIALGGVAFYLSNRAISSRILEIEQEATKGKTMQAVVVANRPMLAGEIIESGSVAIRQIPAEFVNSNTVTPDNYDSVDGQAITVDIARGDALQMSYAAGRGGDIFAATLKSGRRALTIEVDEISSISGLLRPGDHVDLMLTARTNAGPSGNSSKEITFPLLSNVEVLATGRAQKGTAEAVEGQANGYAHVTLDVTPQDATRIITAKSGGRITAVLRAPTDSQRNPSQPLTIDDVVAVNSPEGTAQTVEFLIGGSGNGGAVTKTPMLDSIMNNPAQKLQAEAVARRLMGQGMEQQGNTPSPSESGNQLSSKDSALTGQAKQ